MQLGMIGLGRMGANMVRRLIKDGHDCVVFDLFPKAVQELAAEKATGATSLADFVSKLAQPRAVWLMVPAAAVDSMLAQLVPLLAAGDTVIDGGNSYYIDDIRRSKELAPKKLDYVDVGTSGGVWGLERGYCMMIGGPTATVQRLDPIFRTLGPGIGTIDRTPGRDKVKDGGTAEHGYLHCGPSGAGHFVKMVHNGIEYGIMAAYAEGIGHPPVGERRQADARDRCGNDAAARPRSLSIRSQPAERHRSLATRQRHRVVAARPDRLRAARGSGAVQVRRARLRLG